MPLPPAAARKLMHTRVIDCRGYEREDGLWDIEGRLTDTKPYTWKKRSGPDLPAGQPVHDMWLRISIDTDMVIREAFATTDAGPFAPCGDITPKFSALVGRKITRGWTKELRAILGGPNGCTHQWELLGRVATVAYQTVNRFRPQAPRKPGQIPFHFNTCHMYTPDSDETLNRWPDLYTGPKPRPAQTEAQHERAEQ